MYFEMARAVVGLVVLSTAAFGAGSWIEGLLPRSLSEMERVAVVLLGGLGLLGAGMFVIGLLAFTPAVILPFCATAALIGLVVIRRRGSRLRFEWRAMPVHARLAVLIVAGMLCLTFVGGLSDIVGSIGHDGINYHLLGPKVWLRDGVIRPVLGNTHTAFPQTLEVVFGLSWVLGGPRTPGLSAVLTLALFLAVSAGLARRLPGGTRESAWWCAALLAVMPAVHAGAHSGFIDVFYSALVLVAARIALDAERPAHFIACGLFCGFAMATKYTGLLAAPLVLLCVLYLRWQARPTGNVVAWRSLVVAALVAALPAVAFYLRNAIVLGCPIYPPTPGLLGLCDLRFVSLAWVKDFQDYIYVRRGAGFGRDWLAFLALPFNLTFRTDHFHGAGGIGLSSLALAPLGLRVAWRDQAARALAFLALAMLTVWFLTQQESRFLIHVYAISTCFAVVGWQRVAVSGDRVARRLAAVIVAVSIGYGGLVILRERQEALHAAVSPAYAARVLREETPHYDAFEYLNARATAKVMVMSMHIPAYYLDGDFLLAYEGWRGPVPAGMSEDDATRARWRALGVTYLLDVHDKWGGYALPRGTAIATLVFERDGARVYRVR